MKTHIKKSFHNLEVSRNLIGGFPNSALNKTTTYSFNNFFHPFIGDFIQRLNHGELSEFMKSDLEIEDQEFFDGTYTKASGNLKIKSFLKKVDFSPEGPYSIYNWEIFYHIPITIAVQLSKNQRFLEAQKWFHFVFNPLTNEEEDENNPTARYWNFKDFRDHASQAKLITELLTELSNGEESEELNKLRESINHWKETPFSPHEVAKFRPLAYQFDVVMKYIDNLVAWGDSLFRQFTIETLNEATQLYILAGNILGEKPKKVPRLEKRKVRNYKDLKNKLDDFSNAMEEMENDFPLNSNIPGSNHANTVGVNAAFGMSQQLYFCIPKNDKLLAYWDLVADRLFKIRHCMDIEGNVRQIPLFQPSIDPGMLIRAAASGMDVGTIMGGLDQPVSNVRFPVIAQKASELINEVKSLGGTLLSAFEKGDAESLALIRQKQEIKILELSQDIKYLQWKESESSIESLLKTRESAYQRYRHYQILLGKEEGDFKDLEKLNIVPKDLNEENFDDVYSGLVGKYSKKIKLEDYRKEKLGVAGAVADAVSGVTGASDSVLGVGSSDNLQLNKMENMDLNVFMPLALRFNSESAGFGTIAPLLALIPENSIDTAPMGVGMSFKFGGRELSGFSNATSMYIRQIADILNYQGARASKLGSYKRRIDDWVLQSNLAAKELEQIGTQIISSLIREQISKKEYENHAVQIENSHEIDTFLKEQKFGHEELYLWMQAEISKTYYEFYKLAFDTAKKAEATMKHELMRKELDERDFIKFNYWDAGRKGLLSGETLALDMKKMELAYMESNKREFEITKHISLMQLNPLALLQLKVTEECEVDIPEWLFDLDYPGHYMRRIKSVGLSIPVIAGSHTSVNCTLSLQKSTLRTSALGSESYQRKTDENDDRFRDYLGTVESIVTSSGQNDSGLFETNLRDERFLPFEGAGAVSTWKLELPTQFKQFDYNTISDVIIHMRYTARQGGALLRSGENESGGAEGYLKNIIEKETSSPLVRMFSLKHDFPDEWHRFINSLDEFSVTIRKSHFPYLVQDKTLDINMIKLISMSDFNETTSPSGVDLNEINEKIKSEEKKAELTFTTDVLQRDKDANVFLLIRYTLE